MCAGRLSAFSCPRTLAPRRTNPGGPPAASCHPSSPLVQRTGTVGPGVHLFVRKDFSLIQNLARCINDKEKQMRILLLKLKQLFVITIYLW